MEQIIFLLDLRLILLEKHSYTFYDGTSDQTILGGVAYGNLYLQGLSTKTIALGDIGIQRI